MALDQAKKYVLAPGSQVREEDFGLLFYSMHGPRLFFLNCGRQLAPGFFEGRHTLEEWWRESRLGAKEPAEGLRKSLEQLSEKGVIRGL